MTQQAPYQEHLKMAKDQKDVRLELWSQPHCFNLTSLVIVMSIRLTTLMGSGKVSTALALVLSPVPVEGFLYPVHLLTFKRERSKSLSLAAWCP